MAATYFSLPSFARAKKHTEDLAKTNPKKPVLDDEDERLLERLSSNGDRADTTATKTKDTRQADGGSQVIFPGSEFPDDPPESIPVDHSNDDDEEQQAPVLPPRPRSKKDDLAELPSQEEAEAATKGFTSETQAAAADNGNEKRTWSSYIPSVPSLARATSTKDKTDKDDRTWSEYATSLVPNSLQSLPGLPASWSKSKDAKPEPVLNEDGSINEQATKEKEEKEVSILLDNLNLSSINNRVFAFTDESQKLYERFIQALKDTMNGVPTAYEDMEKIMKEAAPTIEKQWNAMPAFVQTLVKTSLAKVSATEMLAAVSQYPSNDAKAKVAANKAASKADAKKPSKKRRSIIPNFKGLVKKEGLAATLLQNITTFLKTRFPILLGATNVAMSLSVLILMLVFYYCWKRGRDTRLAKEAEANAADGAEDEDDEIDVELTDEDSNETATKEAVEQTREVPDVEVPHENTIAATSGDKEV